MTKFSKERMQKLAGLKRVNQNDLKNTKQGLIEEMKKSQEERSEALLEGLKMMGMASPAPMGNPFGERYDLTEEEKKTEDEPAELDPDKVNVEDDDEGTMAKGQLEKIKKYAEDLLEKLPEDAKLDAWVQAKLTLAAEMMDVVGHYLQDEAGNDQ